MRSTLLIALTVLAALVFTACAPPPPVATVPDAEPTTVAETVPEMMDIVDTAVAAGSFNTLVAAVDAAGLVDTLKGDGPFTVFAPTDDAFAALPEGTVEALLADIPTLTNILLYHVVPGKVMASDVVGLDSADTAAGLPVAISVDGDKVMIGNAQVVTTDIETSNGVIHVVDAVILPPAEEAAEEAMDIVDTAVAAGSFNTLVAAVDAAGLVETLKGDGPFTVFAPTDDAFAALPEGTVEALLADIPALTNILLYHVVPGKVMAADVVGLDSADTAAGLPVAISVDGDKVMIGNAQVITTDIETSNGVIHVVDAVILPPAEEAAEEAMDIVDTAVAAGSFNTLVAAVDAAGLVETLKGDGPFTVFAPTDAAFAALPEGTVEALLADIPALTNILLYHVVPGKVMAADVVGLDSADTAAGLPVAISIEGDKVMVGNAQVLTTDVETSNGVIHVVDAVILPPADQAESSCPAPEGWVQVTVEKGQKVKDIAKQAGATPREIKDANCLPDYNINAGDMLWVPQSHDAAMDSSMAKDIVETAIASGDFNTLVAAVVAADLVETLQGDGPFTVFAPTDDAFAALPKGTVEALLADIPALTNILLYHVVPGKVMAADVVGLDSADTAAGLPVAISVEGDKVMVGNAQVLVTDIETSNGVIHVVDAVILPPAN